MRLVGSVAEVGGHGFGAASVGGGIAGGTASGEAVVLGEVLDGGAGGLGGGGFLGGDGVLVGVERVVAGFGVVTIDRVEMQFGIGLGDVGDDVVGIEVGHVLEVGDGGLESVEEEAGGLVVEASVEDPGEDLGEGGLDAVRVVELGERGEDDAWAVVEVVVVVAEGGAAECGRAAADAGGAEVGAAWRLMGGLGLWSLFGLPF